MVCERQNNCSAEQVTTADLARLLLNLSAKLDAFIEGRKYWHENSEVSNLRSDRKRPGKKVKQKRSNSIRKLTRKRCATTRLVQVKKIRHEWFNKLNSYYRQPVLCWIQFFGEVLWSCYAEINYWKFIRLKVHKENLFMDLC